VTRVSDVAATRTVVITGASGFIGRHLAEAYRARGATVRGIDLEPDPAQGIVAGDVSRPGRWQAAFAGADVAVHTAALVGMPTPRQPERYWRVNVAGTRHVLDAARAAEVRRVVVLSSIVVFGLDFPDQVDESYPVRPTAVPYVDTKIATEQVALAAHAAGEVEVTVVRPGDVYGPGSVWVREPLRMLRTRTFVLPARGRGIFSPVHVDDLVRGLVAAGETPQAAGAVLTLSGGVGVPARVFFDHLGAMLGRPVPAVPTPALLAVAGATGVGARMLRRSSVLSADAARYLGERRGTYSIARATRVLGWSPTVSLSEGMAGVERWARSAGLLGGGAA
jgi:nucleoside-diphosphate-sugar epimerase